MVQMVPQLLFDGAQAARDVATGMARCRRDLLRRPAADFAQGEHGEIPPALTVLERKDRLQSGPQLATREPLQNDFFTLSIDHTHAEGS